MGHDARINPISHEAKLDPIVKDMRGRSLQEGDELILNVGGPIFFRVVKIAPVLNPGAPANLMKIEVAAALNWQAIREQINVEFIRVRTAEEAGPMVFRRLPDDDGKQAL